MFNQISAISTLGVRDLDEARSFYGSTLGLKSLGSHDGGESELFSSGKSTISIYKSDYAGSNKATALSWEVEDVDKEVAELKSKGVTFEHYNMPEMTLEGDVHVGGDMRAAWFKDPSGNILCLSNLH